MTVRAVRAVRTLKALSVLPYVMMVSVAAIDGASGPDVGLLPLVAVGPAFASLTGGMRRTALIGLLALALCVLVGWHDGRFTGDDSRRGYTALLAVAGVTAAGLIAAVMRQRREAELASVRSIAEVAQRVLLRPVPRSAGNLRVAVSYTSAVAEARIGGDLYEVVASPHGVRAIVGDVQGKGLDAVETAAVVLGAFREAAYAEADLAAVGAWLERALGRQLLAESFVTAVLIEAEAGRRMTLLNYGHPAPLALRTDGTACFLTPPQRALPLGLQAQHGGRPPRAHQAAFRPGDQVLFYTDGVSEARDTHGSFYPLDQRVHLLKDPNPEAALEAVRRDLMTHTAGPLHDDAAMLLLRYRHT